MTAAENILRVLESQRFADWHNEGRFDSYVRGDLPEVSKEAILEDIERMFSSVIPVKEE